LLGESMNKRNLTIMGLAVIAIMMGGIGLVLAQNTTTDAPLCDGTGAQLGLMNGRGFWSQLTVEQRTALAEQTQAMLDAGATHEEIQAMKASMLQEWGIDAPLWSGPHTGGMSVGYGQQLRDGSGGGRQFSGRGNGGHGYNGECPYTN
jgi:hypothetical protein